MGDSTLVIRAGHETPQQSQPFLAGPAFASTFHAAGDPNLLPYTYGRFHNPTWTQFEAALNALEGGQSVVFASGLAAIAAVFGTVVRAGEVVLMPSDQYYITNLYRQGYFAQMGVEMRIADPAQAANWQGVKLLWLESPSNPYLDVYDIAALSQLAHAHGAMVGVDNTTVTALGQQPLALGADFSVASDTKSLTGHSDVVLGHVSVKDEALYTSLVQWRIQMGAIPGPMETWLAHRSLGTLALRLERQSTNALAIAQFLSGHPAVKAVYYPGLASHPAYALSQQQMHYTGPVVSFELADEASAEQFLSRTRLIDTATSFGGLHSTAERRARWGGFLPSGFIRLSAGCEDQADLLADITQAL